MRHTVPMVIVGHSRDYVSGVANIITNSEMIGALAAQHLLGCGLATPPLSSISVNFEQAGFEAAAYLDGIMSGVETEHRVIHAHPTHIVARHSTDVLAVEDEKLALALRFIKENRRQPIRVAEVARAAYLSRRVLVPVTVQLENKDLTFVEQDGAMVGQVAIYGVVTTISNRLVAEFEDDLVATLSPEDLRSGSAGRSAYQRILSLDALQRYRLDFVVKDLNSGNQGLFANAIHLSNRSVFDNPDVGAIVLHRAGSRQSPTVEVAEFLVPPSARMAFVRAVEEISKAKPNRTKALRELGRAVADYPGYAEAWQLRGELQLEQGEREAARESFAEALSADPGFPKPYLSIARLALFDENWEEAALMSERLLKIMPNSAQGNYFNGLANFYLGREEPAERALRFLKDEGFGRRYPIALLHLGMIDARRGRIADAAEEFASYLENMPPEEIPPGQKERLERQLAAWGREDLISDGKPESP